MRVNPNLNPAVQNAEASKTNNAAKTQSAERSKRLTTKEHVSGIEAGKTEFSGRAREMAQAKDVATQAPDVRDERIAELKRRIASGDYKVDAKAIADRMVDDHRGMAGIG